MKITVCMLSILLILQVRVLAQNIGINATGAIPDPSAMLDVSATTKGMLTPRMTTAQRTAINTPAKGLLVYDNDTNSFWFYGGSGWIEITAGTGNSLWTASGANIFNSNAGFVGIGTLNPSAPLEIHANGPALRLSGQSNTIVFYGSGTSREAFIDNEDGDVNFGALNNLQFILGDAPTTSMTMRSDGNIGIGSAHIPKNKLEIGATNQFNGNDLAIGAQGQDFGLAQKSNVVQIASSTNIGLMPGLGSLNVGINTTTPHNRLEIGVMGAAGFNGNDIAVAKGDQALGIVQTNVATIFATTTDIILNPRNNGNGRVGINTNTPRAPLDVESFVPSVPTVYSYLNRDPFFNANYNPGDCNPCSSNTSIFASNAVLASEFDAFSDSRIKDIISVSNTNADLQILKSLRITNYTLKDKIRNGNKTFKKVIAQDVEKVYPQIVSKHTDFIPNVYQTTRNMIQSDSGLILAFAQKHHLSLHAAKIRAMIGDHASMQEYLVQSIPNDSTVVIFADAPQDKQVFVYGEEVNDFRTVDYEGLTTLTISATQELSKQLSVQQAQIALLTRLLQTMKSNRNNHLTGQRTKTKTPPQSSLNTYQRRHSEKLTKRRSLSKA